MDLQAARLDVLAWPFVVLKRDGTQLTEQLRRERGRERDPNA